MFHLVVFLSLLASIDYGVTAVTLDASLLTQRGYNNESLGIYIFGAGNNNINDIDNIDPNAFKGYTKLLGLNLRLNALSKIDFEVFKDLVSFRGLDLSFNPLTQLTNSKKIVFPFFESLSLNGCPLTSLDSNVINSLPNLTTFDFQNGYQLNSLKPNQLSQWKKLQNLYITTKNQTSN